MSPAAQKLQTLDREAAIKEPLWVGSNRPESHPGTTVFRTFKPYNNLGSMTGLS
jgi:hypothetical protein